MFQFCLGGQLQLLALENFTKKNQVSNRIHVIEYETTTFGDVEVKEVAIQDSLNDSSNDGNPILETFAIVTINPVEDVKSSV